MKVWSVDQYHRHHWELIRIQQLGPSTEVLSQKLHFNKTSMGSHANDRWRRSRKKQDKKPNNLCAQFWGLMSKIVIPQVADWLWGSSLQTFPSGRGIQDQTQAGVVLEV